MPSIQRGSLLQYKSEHYGRYYTKLPRLPYSTDFRFMDSTFRGNQELWRLMAAGGPITSGEGKKKFIIFCAKIVEVAHPRIPLARCNYLQCFISDPYVDNETIDGWIRDIWVEPLTELKTYAEEEKKVMRDVYRNLKENGPSQPLSPLEVFRKLKEQG